MNEPPTKTADEAEGNPPHKAEPAIEDDPPAKTLSEGSPLPELDDQRVHWTERYDLDGDGRRDKILVRFTGGGHCCYLLGAKLTSNGREIHLPFELDGGYAGGLDLSNPSRFRIVTDGGFPQMLLEIQTYNGVEHPIPRTWKRQYHITSNYVTVSFPHGRVVVRDAPTPW